VQTQERTLRDRLAVHPLAAQLGLQLVQRTDFERNDLLRVIQVDPALTAAVMRAANTSYAGFTQRVTGVRQAVVMLGHNVSASLIASRIADSVFDEGRFEYPDWLWPHAVVTATTCAVLARRCGASPDEAYTAGLLHEIGWLLAATNGLHLDERDRTHARIGGELLDRWRLPAELVGAVERHHAPIDVGTTRLTRIVVAAHPFAEALGAGSPELNITMLEGLHALRIEAREQTILNEVERELVPITSVLEYVQ
jgi:putative nucleotidyltransferase with HDIG domain